MRTSLPSSPSRPRSAPPGVGALDAVAVFVELTAQPRAGGQRLGVLVECRTTPSRWSIVTLPGSRVVAGVAEDDAVELRRARRRRAGAARRSSDAASAITRTGMGTHGHDNLGNAPDAASERCGDPHRSPCRLPELQVSCSGQRKGRPAGDSRCTPTSALLAWRSALTRTTFQARPTFSIPVITSPAGSSSTGAGRGWRRSGRRGGCGARPRRATAAPARRRCATGHRCRSGAPQEVADGVDPPGHVVEQEDPHEAAPEETVRPPTTRSRSAGSRAATAASSGKPTQRRNVLMTRIALSLSRSGA